MLFAYDPIIESMGGKRMHEAYCCNDPVVLANQVADDLAHDSHGLVNYQIVETRLVDAYPYMVDGFRYDDDSFARDYATKQFHGSWFDYKRFVEDNGIVPLIDSGAIDEVWLYTGNTDAFRTWESTMAGPGGYWCNSPPVEGVSSNRLFVIMGWNFERGVGEAIHSFGHRTESIMVHSYGPWEQNQDNNWNKFTLLDKDAPGLGGVGNVHFPVNGTSDYDYANPRSVQSNADDWYDYPDFKGVTRTFNFHEWSPNGSDPQREYLNWWYDHIPHMSGRGPDGFLNNWWRYIVDPDQFKSWNGNLTYRPGLPSTTLTAPVDGAQVSGVVTVTADAAVKGALGRVDLYVDGQYVATDTLAPYTFEWDTTGLSGLHEILVKAYELQRGVEAVADPILVTV